MTAPFSPAPARGAGMNVDCLLRGSGLAVEDVGLAVIEDETEQVELPGLARLELGEAERLRPEAPGQRGVEPRGQDPRGEDIPVPGIERELRAGRLQRQHQRAPVTGKARLAEALI